MAALRTLGLVLLCVLCLLAASCGGGSAQRATTTAAGDAAGGERCVLSARQRRVISLVERDIVRLHRLEAPLSRFTQRGTPALQAATGRVLYDMGRVSLPVDTRGRLLREAKSAVGLCGLCFGALEAEEPVVDTRIGRNACTSR